MVIVPTSQEKGQVWSYTFKKPDADWYKPEFNDTEWKKGEGAFGAKTSPATDPHGMEDGRHMAAPRK